MMSNSGLVLSVSVRLGSGEACGHVFLQMEMWWI